MGNAHAQMFPGARERKAEQTIDAYEMRKRGLTYKTSAETLHIDIHAAHSLIMDRLKSLNEEFGELAHEMRNAREFSFR